MRPAPGVADGTAGSTTDALHGPRQPTIDCVMVGSSVDTGVVHLALTAVG